MKKRNRNNLIILVVLHLLLLVFPLVSKIGHVHHPAQTHHKFSGAISFDEPEEFCAVCDFEFYSFIVSNPINPVVYLQNIPALNSPEPRIYFAKTPNYFSLRAPPVA
ncbi:MAG: hypothetical protein Q8N05_17345 [Bacteroidota bacterium]|nr:hypothetical protein [Bacteroidota bacterium]